MSSNSKFEFESKILDSNSNFEFETLFKFSMLNLNPKFWIQIQTLNLKPFLKALALDEFQAKFSLGGILES
jgi:hypothetical protein